MKLFNRFFIPLILIFSLSIFIICKDQYLTPQVNDLMVSNITNKNKTIYLTFDDGPSDNTKKILDILDKYDISATFFVVGPSYKLKNELLIEIVNKGHNLAIHSYNHDYKTIYQNESNYLDDFYNCYKWIKDITNIEPHLYRFPGGSSTTIAKKETIQSIITTLENKDYYHVDWNVDSFDSHYNTDTQAIIEATLNEIKKNESNNIYSQTILLHDNSKKTATIKALPNIIENCLSNGYQFKTLTTDSKLIQHIKKPS